MSPRETGDAVGGRLFATQTVQARLTPVESPSTCGGLNYNTFNIILDHTFS